MHPQDQTIFALSSGQLPSAIAIVRVSGPQAGPALIAIAGTIPQARMATRALLPRQPPGCTGKYREALRGVPMSQYPEGKPNGQDL